MNDNTPDTIEVPREWLERLYEIKETIAENGKVNDNGLNYLFGYIDSICVLLKKKP